MNKEDTALVQIAVEQWQRIGAAYAVSLEEGQRVYRTETMACRQQQRLCKLREEHDLENGGTIADMAICRRCPIVLVTRRTCYGNISRGWKHDLDITFADAVLAQEFATGAVAFLNEVINR